MSKRIIIWGIVLLGLGLGARACYQVYRKAFYEYVSVINFTDESKSTLSLKGASVMKIYCNLEEGGNFSSFEINFKFLNVKEEAIIQNLKVEIVSVGKNDEIMLDYVLGYKDTIIAEYFDKSKIRAKNFELLSTICKRVSADRDFNGLTFHYRTEVKPLSKEFRLKITGDVLINGRKLLINKELCMLRTKEWVEIPMMT